MKINQLFLESSDLEGLFEFYVGILGMPGALHNDSLLIRTAESRLYFVESTEDRCYHFAFNIPKNKTASCHKWLKERTTLLPFDGKEIIRHEHWKSDAIYAFDAAGNIIEFISRPSSIEVEGEDYFDPTEDVLNVSEIGLVVESIPAISEVIKPAGLERFSGADEYFSAFGSEEGLFIVLDHQKDFWLPTEIEPEPFPFSALVETNNGQYRVHFDRTLSLDLI